MPRSARIVANFTSFPCIPSLINVIKTRPLILITPPKVRKIAASNVKVLLLHDHPSLLQKCCDLINSEWQRSNTARMYSLKASCDTLPTSLVLVDGANVLGHAKLTPIPSDPHGCFVESVVIEASQRGRGFGSLLMSKAEKYCQTLRLHRIYLSTKGQEEFYRKIGYVECAPVSIYGAGPVMSCQGYKSNCFSRLPVNSTVKLDNHTRHNSSVPVAPPMPSLSSALKLPKPKKFMCKNLNF